MREIIPQKYAVFFKYAIVGCLGTAIDMGSLYVFVEFLHIHLLLAAAMSFILAVINNFTQKKKCTFESKRSNISKQLIKCLLVSIPGLLLPELFFALIAHRLKK